MAEGRFGGVIGCLGPQGYQGSVGFQGFIGCQGMQGAIGPSSSNPTKGKNMVNVARFFWYWAMWFCVWLGIAEIGVSIHMLYNWVAAIQHETHWA